MLYTIILMLTMLKTPWTPVPSTCFIYIDSDGVTHEVCEAKDAPAPNTVKGARNAKHRR